MQVSDESFPQPRDRDVALWRYIDLAKFLDLISSRALPFIRADLLGDPWEGAFTSPMVDARAMATARLDAAPPAPVKAYPFDAQMRARFFLSAGNFSCWHMAEHESAAMWGVYGGRGIALTSTFRRLVEAVNPAVMLRAGTVTYVDYARESFPDDGRTFSAFMYKRVEFAYEREVRLAVYDLSAGTNVSHPYETPDGMPMTMTELHLPPVMPVMVDLETMIGGIVLAPDAPAWMETPLRRTLDAFGLPSIRLTRSRLAGPPMF